MDRAFESLLSENHMSFILTVGFITAGIYYTDTGKIKILDCHAWDAYGKSQPQTVTSVLLKVLSIQNVVQYFQEIHTSGEVYELKGVLFNDMMNLRAKAVKEQIAISETPACPSEGL